MTALTFLVMAALLLLAVVGALLRPLLGAKADAAAEPADRADYDLAVYRDQLVEVERDLERGLFTPEEAQAARLEVERRVLSAAARSETGAPASSRRLRLAAALAVAVLIPAAAGGLYLELGAPGVGDVPLAGRQGGNVAENHDMDKLVGELRARLERDPENANGWLLLARSSLAIGRMQEAAEAFGKAAELTNRAPEILAAWGETVVMIDGNLVPPQARKLFEEALAGDPDESRARFYLGLAKAQSGDLQGALGDWTLLARASPPEAPWLPALTEQINRAAAELGQEPPSLAPVAGPLPPPSAALPGPSQADIEATAAMSPAEREGLIRAMVERLAQRLGEAPDDRDGWLRLGRAYQVMGESAKAEEAFARAQALAPAAKP